MTKRYYLKSRTSA